MVEDEKTDLESKVKVEKDMVMRSTPTPYLKIPNQVREGKIPVKDWPKPNVYFEEKEKENTLILCYEFDFEEDMEE